MSAKVTKYEDPKWPDLQQQVGDAIINERIEPPPRLECGQEVESIHQLGSTSRTLYELSPFMMAPRRESKLIQASRPANDDFTPKLQEYQPVTVIFHP